MIGGCQASEVALSGARSERERERERFTKATIQYSIIRQLHPAGFQKGSYYVSCKRSQKIL